MHGLGICAAVWGRESEENGDSAAGSRGRLSKSKRRIDGTTRNRLPQRNLESPDRRLTRRNFMLRVGLVRVSRQFAVAFLLSALAQSVLGQSSHQTFATGPLHYTFRVVRTFPHDPTAFTQGLAYRDGFFYEGTGLNNQSSLRKVRLETGEIVQRVDLAPEFFGEGITLLKNEVIQLTWQSHVGFVYNVSDFHLLRRFS